ncbi:MAG TPA: hypothetical protein VLH59_12685 [Ignavibacteriaceae bacterium]|nr:hypothetical protein [Ignavibacteriaceae bacterium]
MLKYLKIFLIIISISSFAEAQTFGFGCLGFVGGYGGFTYQQYDAAGLNDYISFFNQLENTVDPVKEFSSATGYRVGLNFFRATFENGIIVTAKGFYQYLSEKNKGTVGVGVNNDNYSMDLTFKNWSIGFDVGWQFTNLVSWKILDGSLNFNNATLTQTTDLPGETIVNKYKSDSGLIGYSIGTGIIVSVIKDYISIEGLAGYTFLEIEDLTNDQGIQFFGDVVLPAIYPNLTSSKIIDSGGFSAVIQLNVGFPLL